MTKQGRYRIQTVSQMTGISTATLRAWERRYGVPSPVRGESSSYRLYSEDDISFLKQLKKLCDQGLAPSEAIPLIQGQNQELSSYQHLITTEVKSNEEIPEQQRFNPFEITNQNLVESHQNIALDQGIHQIIETILTAIYDYQPVVLEQTIRKSLLIGSARQVFDLIFSPVLKTVGTQWSLGKLSVAQEHLATEYIGNATRDLLRLLQSNDQGPLILLTCVEHEQHVLPLYGSALHFMQWGYRTIMLGANTPVPALGDSIKALKPDMVGLSITSEENVDRVKALLPQYAQVCAGIPWLIGGVSAYHLKSEVEALGGLVALGTPQDIRLELEQKLGHHHR